MLLAREGIIIFKSAFSFPLHRVISLEISTAAKMLCAVYQRQ